MHFLLIRSSERITIMSVCVPIFLAKSSAKASFFYKFNLLQVSS